MKFKLLSVAVALSSAYSHAFDGQVVDTDGQAIQGAKVMIPGQRKSATTNEQGAFTLDTENTIELHISAPGYAHKTLMVDGKAGPQRIVLINSAIEQVDVIGIPLHASNIESAMPVNVLTGEELRNKQAATLGDSLANEVGVHTNFHGNVASTPVIRGLSGPRVLITQNSLDVSDVSRVGPDHSVATEVSTSEQVEVLRGPATLFYGSGAIGGVVNVIDKRVPTDTETRGEWLLSHDSVNDQDQAAFNLNTGAGDLAFHADGFWRKSNNYDVPVAPELEDDHDHEGEEEHHDEGLFVENSAEESYGFTIGGSYILDNGFVGLSFGQLDRDYGIPGHSHGDEEHHDDDDEMHDEDEMHEDEHGEEEVRLELKQDRFQVHSELNFEDGFVSALNTRIGYTDYEHTEFEEGTAGTTFANETAEVRVELLHQTLSDWKGGLVFDYKNTKFVAEGEEAFAPASDTNTFALALLEERHFGDVLVQLGARVEHVTIESDAVSISDVEFHHHDEEGEEHEEEEHDEEEHGEEAFSFDESYTPFSVSAGAVWDFAPGYNVGVSFSHAERAPSAAELLSFGPHIATGTFEIGALFERHEEGEEIVYERVEGTPELEKSNNIDLSFRKFEGDVGFIFNAFYNQIDNFYAQFDTELFAAAGHAHEEEGEEEEGHEHAGELPVIEFRANDATLHGFEAQGVWQINNRFKATATADYVDAELDNGGDLPRIPPMRYGLSLDYDYGNISANLSWTRFADQDNIAEFETETDGYNWVNAYINYRIPLESTELTLFLKAENLGDEEARVHSSFLKDLAPRPGRNFRVGIRGTF